MREYFSHDHHARADEKIIKMLKTAGPEGYGLYWMIVEMLHENQGSIPKDYELLAYELRTQCERIKAVCEDYDLFYERDGRISSLSVDRRLQERAEKSTKAKSSAMKRWGGDANAMRTQCEGRGIKGKERKGKEREEGEGEADPPTLSQVREMAEAEHLMADPERYFHTRTTTGWKGILNWKSDYRAWNCREHVNPPAPAPAARVNPADKHFEIMGATLKKNLWHDAHLKGGKCSFCGAKIKPPAVCTCPKYTAASNKAFKLQEAKP